MVRFFAPILLVLVAGVPEYVAGAPAWTCVSAGYLNDPGGICPSGARCTGIMLAGQKCVCAAGMHWDVNHCAVDAATCVVGQFTFDSQCCGSAPASYFWSGPGTGCGAMSGPAWGACGATATACDAGTFGTASQRCCGCPINPSAEWSSMTAAQQAECASPSPSPTPSPTPTPACSFSWADHQCGTGGSIGPSAMPSPVPPGTTWDKLMNPMAACCWNGWCESAVDPTTCKMDCVAAKPGKDFMEFYNAGGPLGGVPSPRPEEDAGVLYPNRLFLLDTQGVPYNGFYDQHGKRCKYSDAAGAAKKLTGGEQLDLFDAAIAANKPPTTGATRVSADCCNVMILGFERTCPMNNPSDGTKWRASPPESVVTRCTAAATMKVHFLLVDLCDPTNKKRARFHGVTSANGIKNSDFMRVDNLDLQMIIQKTYGNKCPAHMTKLPDGTCQIN